MEGARWDMETFSIAESRPKELFTDFPAVHLNPVVLPLLPLLPCLPCVSNSLGEVLHLVHFQEYT